MDLYDELILALSKVFTCFGFSVEENFKAANISHKIKRDGDSGIVYTLPIIATKGKDAIICNIRTSGQRGTQPKIDKGAIQVLMAELDDFAIILHKPSGMIVSPNGIKDEAKQLAQHFGIKVIIIKPSSIQKILQLDEANDRDEIIKEAKGNGINL